MARIPQEVRQARERALAGELTHVKTASVRDSGNQSNSKYGLLPSMFCDANNVEKGDDIDVYADFTRGIVVHTLPWMVDVDDGGEVGGD